MLLAWLLAGPAALAAPPAPTVEWLGNPPDARRLSIPADARGVIAALDTRNGTAALVTGVVSDQPERVLVRLRGAPLARIGKTRQPAAVHRTLTTVRQRAAAAILQRAAVARGRPVARPEIIAHEYSRVFLGFAARLSRAEQAQVRGLQDVEAVYADTDTKTLRCRIEVP